jgi:hypothetical protein
MHSRFIIASVILWLIRYVSPLVQKYSTQKINFVFYTLGSVSLEFALFYQEIVAEIVEQVELMKERSDPLIH